MIITNSCTRAGTAPIAFTAVCCTLTSVRRKCGFSTMGRKTALPKSVSKRVFPAIVLCSPSSRRTSVPIQILLWRELGRYTLHQCSCHVSWLAISPPLTWPHAVPSGHPWWVLTRHALLTLVASMATILLRHIARRETHEGLDTERARRSACAG